MRSSPRVRSLALVLTVVATPVPGAAIDVGALLDAVVTNARFDPPAVATGALIHRHDGRETSIDVRLAGRGLTLRVDAAGTRALVRGATTLLRLDDGTTRLAVDATIGSTNVRFADLAPLTPRPLDVPQIVDQGPAGTVVAGAPRGTSPYVLLVYTIDPVRAVVTRVKYYEWSINNMVKRDRRSEFTDVAGRLRPGLLTVWDVEGDGTSELTLAWRAAPDLARDPFTRAGLADPLPR